jgi:hypothetical protein
VKEKVVRGKAGEGVERREEASFGHVGRWRLVSGLNDVRICLNRLVLSRNLPILANLVLSFRVSAVSTKTWPDILSRGTRGGCRRAVAHFG